MKRLFGGLMVVLALSVAHAGAEDDEREHERDRGRVRILVTNLTAAQVFTPILAVSHTRNVRLFELGSPASVELEALAEAGDTQPLATALGGLRGVGQVVSSGAPLPPGQSVMLMLRAGGPFDRVSVGSMLVPTNDAFFAVNGAPVPRRHVTILSPAYDAGTEMNDEACATIPGPPTVCQGEGFNPGRDGAEGFVHIHRGIHGVGSLNEATYDWRNPVARIRIWR